MKKPQQKVQGTMAEQGVMLSSCQVKQQMSYCRFSWRGFIAG
jgi:hypothetical protein